MRGRVAPQHLARRDRIGEQLPALFERDAFGVVLLALPTGADAEVEPATGELVERRGLLGQERRGAQRRDEDARSRAARAW